METKVLGIETGRAREVTLIYANGIQAERLLVILESTSLGKTSVF